MANGRGENKQQIRNAMDQQRMCLSAAEVMLRSQRIAATLAQLKPVQDARVIMGYCSIRNEVDLTPFLQAVQQQGKTVLLPRVVDHQVMEAVPLDSGNLIAGSLGIPEPEGIVYDPAQIDVILIPGLAYDYQGYRLGYGRGYYDRFLSGIGNNVFRCGVCYEFQVVETIGPHGNDIPVHWIVTDKSELVLDWSYF